MSFRALDVGMVPALVGRVSFTGDLGYEIWVTTDYQRALYDLLTAAGRGHGLRLFGGRALNAMRLEKAFGTWAREYRPIYGPFEAGLGRFVDLAQAGASSAARRRSASSAAVARARLITLSVDAADADAIADEPIWHGDAVVGWVTSGGYGHSVGQSLALGYVEVAHAAASEGFAVEIIGERRRAVRLERPPFDPDGARMRS